MENEARFARYIEGLAGVLGHADRAEPLKDYCTGLLMPVERKSVEPMAAMVSPARASAAHQSLLHFVGQSAWSDEAMLGKVRDLVAPAFAAHGGVEALIVDDTGFQKKGSHSVGVARQYCGRLGKTDNCQIAVTLSLANHHMSLPIGYRLYLPETWAKDAERRAKAHVPEDVKFETKPQIALSQIEAALKAGVARGVVLADAGYGADGGFRARLTALGLTDAVRLAVGRSAAAAQALERHGATALARSARRRSPPALGESPCTATARRDLEPGGMARRLQPGSVLALCRGASQASVARPQPRRAASG
jgi:SRSO17 transposase